MIQVLYKRTIYATTPMHILGVICNIPRSYQLIMYSYITEASEWVSDEILWPFSDIGQWGPCNPYKLCNQDIYIGSIIFPHIYR